MKHPKYAILLVSICLLNSISYGQNRQLKQSLMTTFLGTYNDGELELEEEHAAPTICKWDKDGLFMYSERLDSIDGDPFDAFVYTYNDDGSTKSYVNCNGDRTEIWTTVNYIYDAEGKKLEEIYGDPENKYGSRWIYSYDSLGNLKSEVMQRGGKSLRVNKTVNTYKDSALVEKEIKYFQNDVLISHKIQRFKNDLLLIEANVSNGSLWTYTYNDDKTLKTTTSNFGDGDKIYYHFYEYDKHGNLLLRVECDESGFGLIEVFSRKYYLFRKSKKNKVI